MNNKTFLNTSHILWIKLMVKKITSEYHYREAIPAQEKSFGRIVDGSPEGWYNQYGRLETLEEIKEKNRVIYDEKDNLIWDAPKIEIETICGKSSHTEIKYFKTDEEAYEYAEKIASSFSYVEIEN